MTQDAFLFVNALLLLLVALIQLLIKPRLDERIEDLERRLAEVERQIRPQQEAYPFDENWLVQAINEFHERRRSVHNLNEVFPDGC